VKPSGFQTFTVFFSSTYNTLKKGTEACYILIRAVIKKTLFGHIRVTFMFAVILADWADYPSRFDRFGQSAN
jgi:hypothetical protein